MKSFRIGISHVMSGHFAVMYDTKTGEPEQTGIGRYRTATEAAVEARAWSKSENVPLSKSVADFLEDLRA